MKKIRRKLLSAAIIAACILAAAGLGFVRKNSGTSKQIIDESQELSLNGVKEIFINTSSTDVKLIPTDREKVKLYFSGEIRIKSKEKNAKLEMKASAGGNKLSIMEELNIKGESISYSGRTKLEVYVPRNYLDDIMVNTASGAVNIENCTGNYVITTASGDVDFYQDTELKNSLNINTASGEIDIKLPESTGFNVDAHSSSGKVKCDFLQSEEKNYVKGYVGNGEKSIKAGSSSGNINILKYQ